MGDEGLIMDDSCPDLEPPVAGEVATMRSGSRVCEVQYHVEDPDATQPDWGGEVMEFLATETLP